MSRTRYSRSIPEAPPCGLCFVGKWLMSFHLKANFGLMPTNRPSAVVKDSSTRKRLIVPTPPGVQFDRDHRLDVSTTALVEVTSEEKDHPIESALIPGESKGWRASEPGTHTIRLIFDRPQKLKRISLVFEEKETSRTQEFVLRWSPNPEGALREIVRQQWNFSPPHTTTEVEEYSVELSGATVLEMTITPDIAGGAARASLNSLAVY